jgi:wyosine [tRNA(Phe)-imidazoG37] synthetase (radical SAM superfamily)
MNPMESQDLHYVFGPVVSRRLGRSLGVDVVPFKTCTYDCIYCQLGATTHRTLERNAYVSLEEVLDEIRRKLEGGVVADYITIAGSGEPTLYSDLGPLIAGIKRLTDIPVAVLTNGALLWDPAVQDALLEADVVVPSLDAGGAAAFARVNRPDPAITFERMVEGLVAFRPRFHGHLWLEIFLLRGITDTDAELAQLAAHVQRIRPDRVQLNTVARPTTDGTLQPVPQEDMARFAEIFGPNAEVVAHYEPVPHSHITLAGPEDVLAVIRRHPCTVPDVAQGLGMEIDAATLAIDILLARNAIRAEVRDGATFYRANQG